jgi:two-component system NtrC family sensor kinase
MMQSQDAAEPDVFRVRIRALVRRKLLQDENARVEAELRQRELALERARTEAAAAEARASLAGALARANTELEQANHQLKDTQAKLVQAAKMASLGELVAGIAHEINNPLAFILAHQGTVERLLTEVADKLPPDSGLDGKISKSRERVAAMKLGLARIQELVVNLRRFSRLDEGELKTIKGAGSITIETQSDEKTYTIRISDTGPGIPDELKERIFEPFFTTKPVGTGTGLGLAIAYSVVQAHRGSILVDSGPLGGARFTIMIPRQNIV